VRRLVRSAALAVVLGSAIASGLSAQDRVIHEWLVRGPLPADTGRAGVLRDYLAAEATILPTPGDTIAGGAFTSVTADPAGVVDLNLLAGPSDWSVAYAHTYVWSPDERAVLLVMDSDDDLVGRVNGQRVWVHVVPRGIGAGRDTVRVRLAGGWNTILLKVVNRTGGFDLLGKLAPAPGGGAVHDLRLALERPVGVVRHQFPRTTVDVGPLTVRGSARWRADTLAMRGTIAVAAWGADTVRDVRVTLESRGTAVTDTVIGALVPGEVVALPIAASFAELRAVALGERQLTATARWRGGRRTERLFVDPEPLLRMHGAAVELFDARDTLPTPAELRAPLRAPAAFDGLAVELLTRGLGDGARVELNGVVVPVSAGRAVLCAPCLAGDPLDLVIRPDPSRPLWWLPQAQVRDAGFAEYADGARWAAALGHPLPETARPDASAWLAAIGTPGYARVRAAAAGATAAAAGLRRDTLWLVGNSHIDAAWLWRWRETMDVIRNTWRTSLKLAEVFPGYVFTGSSAAFYDMLDREEPALADSLVAAVRAGSWEPVGGWWVEADLNNSAGESLVRQGLYGQRYFQRRFGRRSTIAWTPDTFGYPWTMPQIFAGSGFTSFVTQKMRWNDSTEFPYNAFWWEGRDGTRILSYNPYGYTHDLDPETLVRERAEDAVRSGIGQQIVLYGVGDHGGGPTMAMLHRAEHLARVPLFPAVRYTGPERAVAAVRAAEPAGGFPVWRDEMYLEYHRGTYTSQAAMKLRNRESEVRLQTVEALAAIDAAPYPREAIERAWRLILFNQFHDILPGSSIDSVYLDAHATYDTAWALLDSLKAASFTRLRARMDTRGRGQAMVAFNPLGWARGGRVGIATGTTGGDTAWIHLDAVPAFGARVVHLPPARARGTGPGAGPDWIENAFLRVEVDTVTGAVVRIYDKRERREALAAGGRANVLQVLDDRPAQWDAWNLMPNPETWEVTAVRRAGGRADGDAARFEIERTWGASVFRQTLVLWRDADYLDVENDVDWHERRKLLKVAFGFSVAPDSATFEIPYGTIGRSGRPRTQAERAKWEMPGQRWADVSAGGYGVSVLNDSKYGWDYRDGVLRLSLLKAPIWPDSTADRGRHRFRFAVLPHPGDWREAGVERRAAEYNVPLVVGLEPAHPGPLGPTTGRGGTDTDGVSVSWLKRAEDNDHLVLRVVEWHGRAADVAVALPCAARRAYRANLLEDVGDPVPVTAGKAHLSLRAFEIATLLVECQP
jgi:alpha-mannosidase